MEITWIDPREPTTSRDDWQIGVDGLILEKNKQSATFLPSVPVEQGWSKHETLIQLAAKGGFSLDQSCKLFKYKASVTKCHAIDSIKH